MLQNIRMELLARQAPEYYPGLILKVKALYVQLAVAWIKEKAGNSNLSAFSKLTKGMSSHTHQSK